MPNGQPRKFPASMTDHALSSSAPPAGMAPTACMALALLALAVFGLALGASHAVRAMPARGAEEDSAASVMDAGNLRGWPLGMESGVGPLLSSACSYNF